MNEKLRDRFLKIARTWVCDGYHLDVRYISVEVDGSAQLLAGSVGLSALPFKEGYEFHVKSGRLRAGQYRQDSHGAMRRLELACEGRLCDQHVDARLTHGSPLGFYSDNPDPNRPGVDLHLRVTTDHSVVFDQAEVLAVDSELRRTDPPFDGLHDLCTWLGLTNPAHHGRQSSIDIRINPPIDLGDVARLEKDVLRLSFRALEKADLSQVELGIRAAPGWGLSRFLAGKAIKWSEPKEGFVHGEVELTLRDADVVQCMLSLGTQTVRRHVLVDRSRARTLRLAAVMSLDPSLDALSGALRYSSKDRDAGRFEKAIATLLFTYGFIPTPLPDSDGPDLLVGTPGGRLALVECTLKVTDVNGKVSKLAARRNRLASDLRAKGHATDIHAVLVCASPRADIVGVDDEVLANHSVTLVTAELLQQALEGVQKPPDPDELLQKASAALIDTQGRATAH